MNGFDSRKRNVQAYMPALQRLVMSCAFLLAPVQAGAATLSLVPRFDVDQVSTGQAITLDVFYDFSEYDYLIGGGFDILFDPTALAVVSVDPVVFGNPDFYFYPEVVGGVISSWGAGDFNSLPLTGHFGSVTFTVLAGMGSASSVSGRDTQGIAGPWCTDLATLCFIPTVVDYNTVTISRVPLPGALVLLGSALLLFAPTIREIRSHGACDNARRC